VAKLIDLDPDDADVYNGFLEIPKRGTLKLDTWPGGMKVPERVSM
jgi:hypothetical protein